LANLKTKSAGGSYPKKAIEKMILRFLCARTFSHSLHPIEPIPAGIANGSCGGIFAHTPRGQPPAAERRFQTLFKVGCR
jgi:hypothetical protein